MPADTGTLTQLRAWIAQQKLGEDSRLPPERELAEVLGVSRGDLRKALKVLEDEGALWRRVGKGTFVGLPPAEETLSLTAIAAVASPAEVMSARLAFEPVLAREAALRASATHIAQLDRCIARARDARTWREYETSDNHFHRTVAEAAGNTVMTALFDQLNAIRRTVVWGRSRDEFPGPSLEHHSHADHARIRDAILARDPAAASDAMLQHLHTVSQGLLTRSAAAE
ncbi:MAG: FadR/GntR family transcriptional regulator [Pseudomonadota bacterium]